MLTTEELNSRSMNYWTELRTLRNICAGHPVRKDRPKGSTLMRAFMGRSFGGYDSFTYERWEEDVGISHPQVKLGVLLDNYLGEAESKLIEAFTAMQKRWPDDG